MNHDEGYALTVDDSGDVRFRISYKPYNYVKGGLDTDATGPPTRGTSRHPAAERSRGDRFPSDRIEFLVFILLTP